jgi:hypothetical protein
MGVRKILPDVDAGRTHLRPHVARFRRKIKEMMHRTATAGIGLASQYGVISLTFTA